LLGQIESYGNGTGAVVADMEAGLGTLTRMAEGSLDRVLLVVNPSVKSIEVAQRARQIIAERNIGAPIVVVANRLRDDADLARITEALDGLDSIAIPEDPAITTADIQARSPVDEAPDSPAVATIDELARSWSMRT
jgi:CO dehydrogenase nickel-insertion accessory protein CooC1